MARRHKYINRTAGDYSVTSTTWTNLDTSLDLQMECQVGDIIRVHINAMWGSQVNTGYLNVCTVVSNNPVNFVGPTEQSGNTGIPAWIGQSSMAGPIGAAKRYMVAAGDLTSGQVTFRLRTMVNAATPPKILAANSTSPLEFAIENIGPQDPT